MFAKLADHGKLWGPSAVWGPQPVAKLMNITPMFTMVYDTQITPTVFMGLINQLITGGHHIVGHDTIQNIGDYKKSRGIPITNQNNGMIEGF